MMPDQLNTKFHTNGRAWCAHICNFGSGALFNVLFRIITPGNFQIAQRPAKAPGNGHFSLNKRQFVHVRVSASQGSGRLSLFRFPCRDVSLFLPFLSIARLVLAKLGYFVKFEIETYLKRPWSTSLIFNDENSNEALRKEQKTCSFIITFSLNDNRYTIMIPFCPMWGCFDRLSFECFLFLLFSFPGWGVIGDSLPYWV